MKKVGKVRITVERFGESGFTVTVKKGWHKNTRHVAETLPHLIKILEKEAKKTFGSII